MKKLSFFHKLVFIGNIIANILLILCFFLPYLPGESSGVFALLNVSLPLIFLFNFLFILYWLIFRKRLVIVSLLLILIGFFIVPTIYKFSDKNIQEPEDAFTILSYNVRNFNKNEILKIKNVDSLIIDFTIEADADVICFQEFHYAMKRAKSLEQYPYKFIDFVYGEPSTRVIQAIYSKYPILEVAPIRFPESSNSAMYADILIDTDTVRFYNVHLQSFNIIPEVSTIKNEDSKRLFSKVKKVIGQQKQQIGIIKEHFKKNKYKKIIVGDFNNTPFSNIYKIMKEDAQDTFVEAGKGFGRTYNLKGMPMRIDYIMPDNNFVVVKHQNYDIKLSDHYPIKATLKIKGLLEK